MTVIGPVLLEQSADTPVYHHTVRRTLAATLPWHALFTHPHRHHASGTGRGQIRVQQQDGLGVSRYWERTSTVVMAAQEDWQIGKVFPHELGHALDHLLFDTQEKKDELHALLHQGNTPDDCNAGHWAMQPYGMAAHSYAPAEAVAWAISHLTGATGMTAYGPHSWGGVWADRIRNLFWERAKGTRVFDDVPPDDTHADAIHRLATLGIIGGYPDGTFRPSAPVTRAQMATMLARLLDQR